MHSHSSLSLAVTVMTVCCTSSSSFTSASYRAWPKYGGLSFLSPIPMRMYLVTAPGEEKNGGQGPLKFTPSRSPSTGKSRRTEKVLTALAPETTGVPAADQRRSQFCYHRRDVRAHEPATKCSTAHGVVNLCRRQEWGDRQPGYRVEYSEQFIFARTAALRGRPFRRYRANVRT